MPYSPMKKSCIKMYDKKGKQSGLMMEGSVAHMETMGQEKSNLMQDMPIDNRGISQMSPYKMDHGSPAKETDPDPKKEKKEEQSAKYKFQNAYLNKGGDIKKLKEVTNRVIDEKGNVRANPGSIREYDETVK